MQRELTTLQDRVRLFFLMERGALGFSGKIIADVCVVDKKEGVEPSRSGS